YLRWNFLCHQFADTVVIRPFDTSELIVERFEDAGQPIKFGLTSATYSIGRNRFDLAFLVGQLNLDRRFFLGAVAIHINGFEDTLRQILFLRRWQFWDQEGKKDRQFFPFGVRVRQDCRKELVAPDECLRTAFEIDLGILVETVSVHRYTAVEERVE